MTVAGHDDGAEYGSGGDALLAAIMDEPLSGDARADAAFMAEYEKAVADLTALQAQLRGLGDALAAPARHTTGQNRTTPKSTTRAASVPVPGRTRHRFAIALGALAATCVAAVFGGVLWSGLSRGTGDAASSAKEAADSAEGGASLYSPEARIACSRVLVEGTVVSITPRADGDVDVVLKVKRYYRPERSVKEHPTITVTLLGTAREDLKPGVYTLVRVPLLADDRQDWEVGWGVGDARKDIERALPGAKGMECPAGGDRTGGDDAPADS
ncbi:hypothetical protein [Streptomyces jeddahensis]|uniref:Uncharacterized protein n=1 Tax=Streptomyces jeddahensis TaxID=1716141 RepID=A0A177HWH4_9ACTN|nr:hypothetical protein [Streptomyces jeddahensis]OAH15253.1 hypothetical protein STSP_13610 [Streptomyces jeddahensis]